MLAQKMRVVIPDDHQLTVHIPDEVPPGPAELIFVIDTSRPSIRESLPSREDALARWDAVNTELTADPRPFRELSADEREARLRLVMGSGRGLVSTSEELARHKREEAELEERRFAR